jgi:sugar phosphate isomerase/epimerase
MPRLRFRIMNTSSRFRPAGFQLYTVRSEFARNVPETLRKLAEIGYQAVEFWGYGGTKSVYKRYTSATLRRLLDDLDLKCCGMHLDLRALSKNALQQTIENNQALGSRYLNVAAARTHMESEKGIGQLADILNEAALACAPHGLSVGYHAHPFDFKKIKGRVAWELLFHRLKPTVNMQMDVGNCLAGKGDPIALLEMFAGRTRTLHLKEHKEITFDSDYYQKVFELCRTRHNVEWFIIEMGGFLGRGFDVPRRALQDLRESGHLGH